MKKLRGICLILSLLTVFQLAAFPVSAEDLVVDTAITAGCHTIDSAVPVLGTGQLVENVESVLLYETGTDTLLYSWNADAQIYPASLVKIMTALIVIRNANMTDVVTVSAQVLSTIPDGAVTADLKENEVLSVQDLLYCMMVGSANDAAAVLADHVSGSQQAFVAEMNQYAADLGCKETVFIDPHGLSREQYSTARDIGRILAAAMEDELFQTFFCAPEYNVPATNKSDERELKSGNLMMDPDSVLYYDARVTGGRTGVGLSGDRCIAATAQSDQLQVISVIIGAKSVYKDDGYTITRIGGYNETKTLLDSCLSGFKPAQVLYDNQALKQYKVLDGASDLVVGPRVSISTVLPADVDTSMLTYRYNETTAGFSAPIEKGQLVSNIEIWNGTVCVAQADLYAMNSVTVKQLSAVDSEEVNGTGVFPVILLVFLGIIVVAFAVLLIMRLISTLRMHTARKRSRRNRRNRRRSR